MKHYGFRHLAAGALAALLALTPAAALAQQEAAGGVHKQETVYGELNADGTAVMTTVSVYLSNPQGLEEIEDVTNLESLDALSGDLPQVEEGGRVTWSARGEDVLYQGESHEALPVAVAIEYELDGEPVAPEALPGRSGHLVMRFTYENRMRQFANIGGRPAMIYTPFTVATVVTLPQAHFTGIVTDADRAVIQGDTTMVMDLAFPGLEESLGRKTEAWGKATMTLEADVEDFILEEITFLVTPRLLEAADLSGLEDLDGFKEGLLEAGEGGEALETGGKSLQGGAYRFARGVDTFDEGAAQLAAGLAQLAQGVPQLTEGARQVADGLEVLRARLREMNLTGEDGVVDLLTWVSQSEEVARLLTVMAGLMDHTGDGVKGLDAAIDALERARDALAEAGATQEQMAAVDTEINRAKAVRDKAAEDARALDEKLSGLREALPTLQERAGQAAGELPALMDGLDQLADGSRQVSDGLATLSAESGTLRDGARELASGSSELKSGAWSLARAVGGFVRGLGAFNEEALDRLTVDMAADIEDFEARKDALLRAAEGYTSFTGQPEGLSCDVTFVLRTPLLQAETTPDALEAETEPEPGESGWQRFVGWLSGIFGG